MCAQVAAPFKINEHVRKRRRSSLTLFYMCTQAGVPFEITDMCACADDLLLLILTVRTGSRAF
jgi:hypothetical protein